MSSASIKKIIPCKKNQLIEMVLDIEKYPEFVPWCLSGKIHSKKESSDLIEIKADLKVGKKIIIIKINGCFLAPVLSASLSLFPPLIFSVVLCKKSLIFCDVRYVLVL